MFDTMIPLSIPQSKANNKIQKKGYLIALEGLDGSGKTTLSKLCMEELRKMGYKVEKFRNSSEYTGYWQTVVETKSNIEKTNPIPMDIDQSLHAFEFLTYVKCVLPKLLEENDFIFSDRYVLGKMILIDINTKKSDSWPKQMLKEMFRIGAIPKPDLSLYLHVSPETARERIIRRGEPLQVQEEKYNLQKALELFNIHKDYYSLKTINCEQDIKTITKTIVHEALNMKKY